MPTFKAVVQQHQERRDGKYPVSIRVTHNRHSFYMPTGLYIGKSQISKRSFEIKDSFVLARTNQTIKDYEQRLLMLDTQTLMQASSAELKRILSKPTQAIDFFAFCESLIQRDGELKRRGLRSALLIIKEMGIKSMTSADFTAHFLAEYKTFLDTKGLKAITKNNYLVALHHAFGQILSSYNTEYTKVITHDPFAGFEYYKREVTTRRAASVDDLRRYFAITPNTPARQIAHDLTLLSFCLCGINIKDLIALKKDNYDPKTRRINYNRSKTKDRRADNAFSSIKIEPEVYDIFCHYLAPESSPMLLKFGYLKSDYSASKHVGLLLSDICKREGLPHRAGR